MLSPEQETKLFNLIRFRGISQGDFELFSGSKSNYYFDGKMVSTDPEGIYLLGKKLLELLAGLDIKAVGGPIIGAVPLVTIVAAMSFSEDKPIPAFYVRAEPKGHGTKKLIEGNIPPRGSKVAIVDDVITRGTSILRAIKATEEQGCVIEEIVVVLDRQEGGSEELRRQGYNFTALYESNELGEVRVVGTGNIEGQLSEGLLRT